MKFAIILKRTVFKVKTPQNILTNDQSYVDD